MRGHSPTAAGVLILPVTVPMIFVSPFSGRLIGRFGGPPADDRRHGLRRRRPAAADGGVRAESAFGLILAAYLLFGIALGLVYAPMSTAAMAAMPGEKVGIASGVLAMDRVLAGAILIWAYVRDPSPLE